MNLKPESLYDLSVIVSARNDPDVIGRSRNLTFRTSKESRLCSSHV